MATAGSAPPERSSNPPQLDYAPRPPWHRRKRARRMVLALLLLAMAGSLCYWRRPLWNHAQLLYWQRQCMRFTAPSDWIAYEQDPTTKSKPLLQRADYYGIDIWFGNLSCETAAAYAPPCFSRLAAAWPLLTRWRNFDGAVVFLHERTSRQGIQRLVVVHAFPAASSHLKLEPRVIKPAGWLRRPVHLQPPTGLYSLADKFPPRLRFYAGQPDPSDSAHFTIRYELDDRDFGPRGAGIIDGRLSDDGGHVTLTVRDGPAVLDP